MKYKALFILPNVSANRLGISLTETYDVTVETPDIAPSDILNYVVVSSDSFSKDFLIEIHRFVFTEDLVTISGWVTYDPKGQPTLCRGALQLRHQ